MSISLFDSIYCTITIIIGIICYFTMLTKTKDRLNPFGVVCLVWCSLGGIASLHLSWMETPWSAEMYCIVLIFPILVFFCGSLKTGKVADDKILYIKFSSGFVFLTRLLFVICLICAILEWGHNNFFITLKNGAADVKSEFASIPVIHYGTIYFPYCAISSVFELIYREKKNIKTKIYLLGTIIANIFYALFIGASRGTLIIMFCAFVYLFFRKYRISLRWIALLIFGMILAFVIISRIRIFPDSLVYRVITDHPLISSVYSYTVLSFENLNRLIQRGPAYTIIVMTYGGFLELLGLKGLFKTPEYVTTYFFNANPICYDFYEDLGLIGVIVNTLILFGCIRIIYRKSITDRRYLLLIATMQKAIWMVFFGNYFTIYRVMIFPYLVTALVVYSMKVHITSSGKIHIHKHRDKGLIKL